MAERHERRRDELGEAEAALRALEVGAPEGPEQDAHQQDADGEADAGAASVGTSTFCAIPHFTCSEPAVASTAPVIRQTTT
jgi:hypothetical protein